jgi:2',3'-cyclic-nucleotide 2'-phosphodiesterase (5'-nucleotidase family)
MGGLARRVGYMKAFRVRSNAEVPTLFVDAGNFFTDERFSGGPPPPDVAAKNKWVVKGYGEFRHDAANISYLDLPYLTQLLNRDGYDERIEEYPFIKRIISANVQPLTDDLHSPAQYVIREVSLARSAGRKLKIGITGFTDLRPVRPNEKDTAYAGFQITDPFEAARGILPELKAKVDFVVVLAYMTQEQAQRLASENPEIDTLIGAARIHSTSEPQHFNRATITYAFDQTKHLGELRVYLNEDGSIRQQVNRYVALDSIIPDDGYALQTVTMAHTEFTNEQNQGAHTAPLRGDAASLLSVSNSPFVGVETCSTCHTREYEIWQKTGHAHAMATLEAKNQQFDTECVQCHVVGYKKGGFQSLITTPQFANVQCESCHGPGRRHSESPAKGYGFVPTPVGCTQCHTQPNSPDFNFEVYWATVKH